MIEALIWIFFFYALYRFIRSSIHNAVKKGIRDYETQKEEERHSQNEVKIDRKDIEDAKYEDLK
ncbi:MAG: hypothetical protein M1378_12665 [Bacteroidetes bacterium]|nr:hypothetical protein [Bacteroidota bacterium]